MSDTLLIMSQKGFGVVGVRFADRYLRGITTGGDLRRHLTGLLDMTAGEVITHHPRTFGPSTLVADAIGVMQEKMTCLFEVYPNGPAKVLGIQHIRNCLRAGAA